MQPIEQVTLMLPVDGLPTGREALSVKLDSRAIDSLHEPSEAITPIEPPMQVLASGVPAIGATQLDDTQTHTDMGLARRFVQEAQGSVRFLKDQGKWITWTGTHWQRDEAMTGPRRVAAAVGDALWAELNSKPRNGVNAAMFRFIQSAGSRRAIQAMIDLASADESICVDSTLLDANPYLLNCKNGVLNLLTVDLMPHSPDLLLTQMANVEVDFEANSPRWRTFIEEVTCGDAALAEFLQRSFGVAASGDVSCQAFWVHYGHGANGKSTALEVISTILGDYAGPIAAEALLANPRGHEKERAVTVSSLVGKRLAVAAEPDTGMRLSEGMIKSLTGAETVEARHLWGRPFKAVPTWHPHFTVNHKPAVRGTDLGIWRRVMLVPWSATFTGDKADPHLKERLLAEASGILNWLICGFISFREKKGLGPPESVVAATNEYRSENDRLGEWLEECCIENPDAQTPAADLYASYQSWCKTTNEFLQNRTAFGRQLTERNFKGEKIGGRRVWYGISLASFF